MDSNPFFDTEILKLLKTVKPNSAEEDTGKYDADLLESMDLVIVDSVEELENYLT